MKTRLSLPALTAVHSGLQTQQQVGESGLAGPGQVAVQAAALLPQVQFAGFGQRVTDPVVLGDQLLADGQCIAALAGGGERDKQVRWCPSLCFPLSLENH